MLNKVSVPIWIEKIPPGKYKKDQIQEFSSLTFTFSPFYKPFLDLPVTIQKEIRYPIPLYKNDFMWHQVPEHVADRGQRGQEAGRQQSHR